MVDRLSITRNSRSRPSLYSDVINHSLDRALALDGKISNDTEAMQGMSGRRYRYFINNLIGKIPNARYLEIGSWRGSTACSAMDGNKLHIMCIDNWSEFGGPKAEFHENTAKILTDDIDFRFVEKDFRQVNYSDIGKFNVYLFDGPHDMKDQFDGLAMVLPALDETFVFIVDDWNFERVRQGTFDAISAKGVNVLSSIEIRTTQDGTVCETMCESSDWHNGYFIGVVSKPKGSKLGLPAALSRLVDGLRGLRSKR